MLFCSMAHVFIFTVQRQSTEASGGETAGHKELRMHCCSLWRTPRVSLSVQEDNTRSNTTASLMMLTLPSDVCHLNSPTRRTLTTLTSYPLPPGNHIYDSPIFKLIFLFNIYFCLFTYSGYHLIVRGTVRACEQGCCVLYRISRLLWQYRPN